MLTIVLPDWQTITNGDISSDIFTPYGRVVPYTLSNPTEFIDRVAEADVILCNKTILDEKSLVKATHLRYVGLFATGYNNVDLTYADAHGITVCNAGSYSTDAVAQHTFALILEHASRVGEYDAFVQAGGWLRSPTFSPFVCPTMELAGKTLGLFGYGHIGRKVAEIAKAFGMRVLVHTRTAPNDGTEAVSFERLLAESDFISVHAPLNEGTRLKFDAAAFAACKTGAYFVNTARGPIVDEQALADAVRSGKLSGAAVDVLHTEPMAEGCPLLGVKGITLTPHVAWAPFETRSRLMGIVCDNLRNWINGCPTNVVNHPRG